MFFGLLDPVVLSPDPDPLIIKQKYIVLKILDSYWFVTS
jgi:hypothetical protein